MNVVTIAGVIVAMATVICNTDGFYFDSSSSSDLDEFRYYHYGHGRRIDFGRVEGNQQRNDSASVSGTTYDGNRRTINDGDRRTMSSNDFYGNRRRYPSDSRRRYYSGSRRRYHSDSESGDVVENVISIYRAIVDEIDRMGRLRRARQQVYGIH
ncbi:uncharacterized protein LOC123544524 [Mercenaria mercenaria]|uniref:uncharacterized protein LOC123544524 n=1 Tax=Mercenaria mercenaria TaxID=6596 RepID=UPI00234E7E9A|nr:uncharacterized protein LOC123544524 [Mercenaria mercenaria]